LSICLAFASSRPVSRRLMSTAMLVMSAHLCSPGFMWFFSVSSLQVRNAVSYFSSVLFAFDSAEQPRESASAPRRGTIFVMNPRLMGAPCVAASLARLDARVTIHARSCRELGLASRLDHHPCPHVRERRHLVDLVVVQGHAAERPVPL